MDLEALLKRNIKSEINYLNTSIERMREDERILERALSSISDVDLIFDIGDIFITKLKDLHKHRDMIIEHNERHGIHVYCKFGTHMLCNMYFAAGEFEG